jgi:acid stress chaperone HdeB
MVWSKRFVFSLLGVLVVSGALAQVTIDVSKITCDQYLQQKVATPKLLAAWLSGFYSGKRNSTLVDTQKLEANADSVSAYCESNRNVMLMKAVETTLGKGK